MLGELHVALLKSIIKDIEDVARTPLVALGVNPGGGHPHIVEGVGVFVCADLMLFQSFYFSFKLVCYVLLSDRHMLVYS